MKEGFIFNKASLKFLRKSTFKTFGGGGGTIKEPSCHPVSEPWRTSRKT